MATPCRSAVSPLLVRQRRRLERRRGDLRAPAERQRRDGSGTRSRSPHRVPLDIEHVDTPSASAHQHAAVRGREGGDLVARVKEGCRGEGGRRRRFAATDVDCNLAIVSVFFVDAAGGAGEARRLQRNFSCFAGRGGGRSFSGGGGRGGGRGGQGGDGRCSIDGRRGLIDVAAHRCRRRRCRRHARRALLPVLHCAAALVRHGTQRGRQRRRAPRNGEREKEREKTKK